MKHHLALVALALVCANVLAELPDNLVAEKIPEIPGQLRAQVQPYLEGRSAIFQSWRPAKRELLITTRFADTAQLHLVAHPGGARQQLTFFSEPVGGASYQPNVGQYLVFAQDTGGGEFYQLYRFDPQTSEIVMLTDGKSRNTGVRWARSGNQLAYTSTRRTGRDNDIYIVNPVQPGSTRLAFQLTGGGWSIQDWSHDETRLLISEYVSINESYLYLGDISTGDKRLLTPKNGDKISFRQAQFAKDGNSAYVTTDKGAEFLQLSRIDLATGKLTPLTAHIAWDVSEFELSPDGEQIAFITNEDGIGKLHLLDTRTERERAVHDLPVGVLAGLQWHDNGRDLAFNISSAQSPADVYSFDVTQSKLERWTQSETGGLNPRHFAEPELVRITSFDGLPISAFVYRPDQAKFPGKRPVLVSIHGGPESQSRPIFQGRNNYLVNELGLALVYPNVRGSAGFGKTFLTLDNGMKREDSVKDIGAVLDWLETDPNLDAARAAVIGGSYGGYMVLASMVHFSDRLRCGIDIVGISNFVTFLLNTQDYRRDLRRAEYGDERDPEMRTFLEKISPAKNVSRITKPLFVVQGQNDPRVPLSESEQMVKAIRDHGGSVWYLMAKDEGHGFAKKKNADIQFLATILFLKQHLLAQGRVTNSTHVFKRVGDLEIKADVHRLDDDKVRPVIVWIHGGALIMGGRESIGRYGQQLANEGFVVVSIDYRLGPETKLPAIIEDVDDAFKWVRAHGPALFHADPNRIGVWGASAGGYLTLTAGYRVDPPPQVLVSIFGYGDLIGHWYSKPSPHARHHQIRMTEAEARAQVAGPPIANARDRKGNGGAFYQFCRQHGIWPREISGWDPAREAAKFDPFMPLKNVSAKYPPTFLMHGTADTDVPYEQSVQMADEFKKRGVPHEFVTLPNGEHGFGGADPALVEAAYQSAIAFTKRYLMSPE